LKAFFLLHKIAVLAQAAEILRRHPVTDLTLAYCTEGGRMSEAAIRERLGPQLEGRQVAFRAFNLFTDRPQLHALIRATHWELVAIPFVGGRPYYKTRAWFPATVRFIVLSDGTCECTSLLDFYRRIRIHTPPDYAKVALMMAGIVLLARADAAYSLFHPLPCCFARRTLPAPPLPIHPARAERIRAMAHGAGPIDYICPGYNVAFEDVVRRFDCRNPVATSKRPAHEDDIVVGEDIVDVLRPRRVIGYCCEVLMYAKRFHPETECIAIMDPATDSKWGRDHNRIFRKQAARIGAMRFVSFDDYLRM